MVLYSLNQFQRGLSLLLVAIVISYYFDSPAKIFSFKPFLKMPSLQAGDHFPEGVAFSYVSATTISCQWWHWLDEGPDGSHIPKRKLKLPRVASLNSTMQAKSLQTKRLSCSPFQVISFPSLLALIFNKAIICQITC